MRTPLLLLLLAATAACADGPEPTAGPVVAVTLPPIASLTRMVAGDAVEVRTLLPPGAHPDTYEATPRVARAMAGADLVVRVGAAADSWLGPVGDAHEVVLTDGMRLEGQSGPGTGNPHVWLDPILVRDVLLPKIAAGLMAVVSDGAGVRDQAAAPGAVVGDAAPVSDGAAIRDRAAALADSLTALDAEIRAMLDGVRGRRFIAAHPAWVYFAERYGLVQAGAVHASPGAELGARELARLVDEVRHEGVRAIIAEPQLGRAGLGALADELGLPVVVADALGGPQLEGREDYLALMRFNARAFARALGGN